VRFQGFVTAVRDLVAAAAVKQHDPADILPKRGSMPPRSAADGHDG
jgi:hypothetical protein